MGEAKAITYQEVLKNSDNDRAKAQDAWIKICDIAGSGHIPIGDNGASPIDISGLSEGKQGRIDKVVSGGKDEPEAEDEAAAEDKSNKRGKA